MVAASCRVPDEITLGYGHTFAGDSSLEGWPIENEDSDTVSVASTWFTGPRGVRMENVVPPKIDWEITPVAKNVQGELQGPPIPAGLNDREGGAASIPGAAAVETFNALDWITRICLTIAVCWLGWVYRARLGKLIPRFGNGNGRSKAADRE